MELSVPALAPAAVLSAVVGLFHASLYLAVRGRLRPHLLAVVPAAIAGAWIGGTVGARMGDAVRVGDFGLLWASGLAWVGLGLVVGASLLVPAQPPREDPDR